MFTEQQRIIGMGVAFGMIAGAVIGTVTDNLGLWVALGVSFGALVGVVVSRALQTRRSG